MDCTGLPLSEDTLTVAGFRMIVNASVSVNVVSISTIYAFTLVTAVQNTGERMVFLQHTLRLRGAFVLIGKSADP